MSKSGYNPKSNYSKQDLRSSRLQREGGSGSGIVPLQAGPTQLFL